MSPELATQLDTLALLELTRTERFYRDQGEWELLAQCYLPDSFVRTTWFEGTGREFAEASRDMALNRGRHSKHMIWPGHVRINGDRALIESPAEIHNRDVFGGVEVDTVQYCRFFSRACRTPGGWRLASFEGIYQKDTITPTNPNDTVDLDWEQLRRLRPSYRIWAYAMTVKGYQVSDDKVGDDRPDLLKAFYAAADAWLAGESA
jgi:hypothetical protein